MKRRGGIFGIVLFMFFVPIFLLKEMLKWNVPAGSRKRRK